MAVSAREKLLGAEPPAMISNLQNLADIVGEVEIYLDSVGKLGKAVATCQRSLEVGLGDTEEYGRRMVCFIFMKLYDGGSRESTRKEKAKEKKWEQEAATGGWCAGVMAIITVGARNYWCVKYITSGAHFPVLPWVLLSFFFPLP
ncbi:hypothetical protein L873DRAFT_668454 [Choiromyces venosus 120613-1]|uniref:Uncharacterized protein n=1 Tax=Choiromyces venosus 120613-1 TaxID=1336337 RepID=A0A3N4IYC4_9PEZI|nr:hypothetical protein L873DRAFT_668454 [Choiromyces venosus 120613-1]